MSDEFVLKETQPFDNSNGNGQKKDFSPIPDQTFVEAEVVEAEKKLHPFFKDDDGNPRPIVNFKFKIVEGEFKNRFVWGETPTTFTSHEDCKLRQWVQEILGGTLEPGFRFTLDQLKGNHVKILIGAREYYSKKNQRNEIANSVQDLISVNTQPVSAAQVASAVQGAQAMLTDDDDDFGEEPF